MSALFLAWCLKLTILLLATTSRTADCQTVIDPCNPPLYCVSGTIPDPEDCKNFKICDNGRWTTLSCADGALFDNITLECETASGASCQPKCPPVTGTTILPTTLPPGLCPDDNITSCYNEPPLEKKFPDRSSCFSYFLCQIVNGLPDYIRQNCLPGDYFDIDRSDCIKFDDNFYTNCGYRCRTPAPTTDDVATTTSGQLTTVPSTAALSTAATTAESVTGDTTVTSRLPTQSGTTPGSSSSGGGGTTNYPNSATTLRITILSSSASPAATTTTLTEPFDIIPIVAGCVAGGIVVIVVAIVIFVIVYRKKKRLNAITPNSSKEILPDSDDIDAELGEHREDRTPTPDNKPDAAVFSSDHEALIPGENVKKASTLPPIGPPQNVAGNDVTLTAVKDVPTVAADAAAVITPQNKTYAKKTKKFRRRLLEPFANQHPTREQVLQTVAAYKKKHEKLLKEQWDERQKEIDENYNNLLKEVQFDASQAHHLFTEKMSSVEHNDHDTIGRLASEHVNELTSLWRKQQQLLSEQEAALRQRLDVDKLTSKEMSSLDVNGKKMKKLLKRHEQEVENLNQRFMHDVVAASSDDELQRIIEQYRVEQGEMQDRHLAERLSYGARLHRAVRKQEIEQLDTAWSETCAELDKTYSYPVAVMNPATMHEVMNEHLNELDAAARKHQNAGSNGTTSSASSSSTATAEKPSAEQQPGDDVGSTSAGKRPKNTTSAAATTSTAEVLATTAAVSAANRARRNTPWMFGGSKATPSLQQRRLTIIEDLDDDELEENDRGGTSSNADLGERAPTTEEKTKSRQPEVDLAATTATPSSFSSFDQQPTDVRSAWQDEPPATSQRASTGRRFSAYETPVSQQLGSNNATVGGLSFPVQPTRRRISVMERGADIEDIQRQMMEEYHTTRKRVKEVNTYQREITDEKLREKLRQYQQQKKLKQQQQRRSSRSDSTVSNS